MTTAAEIIANAMHTFGILDQTEDPQPEEIANGVIVLNNLLRADQADGACQFLIRRTVQQLPAGVSGQVYSFSIGTADATYAVQLDAVAVRAIWMNDLNLTVNRETRMAPSADVVRTTYPGIITKWHQERQADGSVLVTAWQPPRASAQALIEYGARLAPITAPDGSDTVALPPEGIDDTTLLFGRRICGGYGRPLGALDPVLAGDVERVHMKWRNYALGQQWLRLVRA